MERGSALSPRWPHPTRPQHSPAVSLLGMPFLWFWLARTHVDFWANFSWYASHSSSVMRTFLILPCPAPAFCALSMFFRARTPRVIELRLRSSGGRSGRHPNRIAGEGEHAAEERGVESPSSCESNVSGREGFDSAIESCEADGERGGTEREDSASSEEWVGEPAARALNC